MCLRLHSFLIDMVDVRKMRSTGSYKTDSAVSRIAFLSFPRGASGKVPYHRCECSRYGDRFRHHQGRFSVCTHPCLPPNAPTRGPSEPAPHAVTSSSPERYRDGVRGVESLGMFCSAHLSGNSPEAAHEPAARSFPSPVGDTCPMCHR